MRRYIRKDHVAPLLVCVIKIRKIGTRDILTFVRTERGVADRESSLPPDRSAEEIPIFKYKIVGGTSFNIGTGGREGRSGTLLSFSALNFYYP